MTSAAVAIIGAGGFAREVHDVLDACGRELVGFYADGHADRELIEGRGAAVLGGVRDVADLPRDVEYVIAIGDGAARRRIDALVQGRQAAVLVHPAAVVGPYRIDFGPGTIVCAGVCVTTNVRSGRHVHVNVGATIGHDSTLGDYVTINPGAAVSGNVHVDTDASIGTRAVLLPGVRVGARSFVGAGACAVRDVPADVVAVGLPARVRQA